MFGDLVPKLVPFFAVVADTLFQVHQVGVELVVDTAARLKVVELTR